MRTPTRTPHALAVFAAAMLLGASAGCIKRPTAKLHDIEVTAFDFRQVDLVFHLAIHNPNSFQINLSALNYGLSSGGVEFATGSLASPIAALSASESTIIRAPVVVEYARLSSVLSKLAAGEEIPYEFHSSATFNWLIFPIPLSLKHSGQMPRLRKPNWHFRDIELIKGPPSWLKLSFEVENPNAFALPLERLKGTVNYGGHAVVRIDEAQLEPIPPGRTAMVSVRARVDGPGVTKAVTKAILSGQRRRFSFAGQLRLGVPELLRKMLVAEEPGGD